MGDWIRTCNMRFNYKINEGKIDVESNSLGTEFSFVFPFEKASSQI